MVSQNRIGLFHGSKCEPAMKQLSRLMPIIAVLVLTILIGCTFSQVLYLKNNVHAHRGDDGELKASYASWVYPTPGHMVIPVNTPIVIGRWQPGFYFITQDTGKRINFEYNQSNMPYNLNSYINLITAPQPIAEGGFSGIDRQGINSGKALAGMNKEAVRVALGYPASHRTPTLYEDVWVYWRNRHRHLRVCFGDDGTVIAVH